ncbi:hypothetical protein QL285_030696 [Trifolium repens]|nr:hypothetical protein QL285_030696 [Trifolium repens]
MHDAFLDMKGSDCTTRILVSCQGQIPWEIGKNPGKRTFAREFARGARAGNAPRRKCFARGYTPVKFPRDKPLSNLPGTNPCETNWRTCYN